MSSLFLTDAGRKLLDKYLLEEMKRIQPPLSHSRLQPEWFTIPPVEGALRFYVGHDPYNSADNIYLMTHWKESPGRRAH